MSETLQSISPYDQSVVGEVVVTPVSEISQIVESSKAAQKEWHLMGLEKRGELLKQFGQAVVEQARDFGEIMSKEMGKPIKAATGEAVACGKFMIREVDEIVEALQPQVREEGDLRETLYFDPLGVSVAVTPWNFPLLMPVWQVLPALAAGNSVILKPSEEVPLTGQMFHDLGQKFLPKGVLQIVHGASEQGKALVQSDAQLVTFTGSKAAGIHILGSASKGLKRVILELGGKDPLVVLDGADIKAAAQFAAGNGFRNSGQVCVSTERIYVDKKVFDEFNSELLSEVKKLKLGNNLEDGVDLGPMVNRKQKQIVMDQIEDARSSGADVFIASDAPNEGFVAPTVVTNVTHDMKLMSEETFGPVVGVMPFESTEEAIELANDSEYGLGAVVFGAKEEALEVGRQLDSGMIGVNKGVSGVPGSPWVGAKNSGYGFHSSPMGHRQFCQVRVLTEKV